MACRGCQERRRKLLQAAHVAKQALATGDVKGAIKATGDVIQHTVVGSGQLAGVIAKDKPEGKK